MTKHIVMFKFREDVPQNVRDEAAAAFKSGIESLPSVIDFIREVHVGFNVNTDEKWDICLEYSFDNLEDVRAYGSHPAHKAVGKALMQFVAERACVDFEQ